MCNAQRRANIDNKQALQLSLIFRFRYLRYRLCFSVLIRGSSLVSQHDLQIRLLGLILLPLPAPLVSSFFVDVLRDIDLVRKMSTFNILHFYA